MCIEHLQNINKNNKNMLDIMHICQPWNVWNRDKWEENIKSRDISEFSIHYYR